MSCNVLIVSEDFRTDRYILEPVLRALVAAAGRPHANVRTCTDPVIGGVARALDLSLLREIVGRYPMVDIFFLVVDRDGRAGRRRALDDRERDLRPDLGLDRALFGQEAWQEVEVWGLAAQTLPRAWSWTEVRAEEHPKERYLEPFVRQHPTVSPIGGGRRDLGTVAGQQYGKVRGRCAELDELEERVRTWLDNP